MKTIQLGSKVRDRISGFTGIVVCRSTWVTGCVRIGVDAKGKADATAWFDEERLDIVPGKGYRRESRFAAAGPQNDPPARESGRR
jgi:hypothetical protein